MTRALLVLCGIVFASSAFSGPHYQSGNIYNTTSLTSGLLIMLDSGLPDNCAGTIAGWMKIPESAKTMIAVTLIAKIQNSGVTVYTDGIDGSGFCIVNQVDPNS